METYSRRENVKFVGLLDEQVNNMNGGDEDHNAAQAQIEDTRGIIYKFLKHQLKIPNAQTSKASPLRKTKQWKLKFDYCTFFALWR